MTDPNGGPPGLNWSARGLLLENCSCQVVCPGHVHFSQLCTHERCLGYWAIRVDEGSFGDVDLTGLKAVLTFSAPRRMIDGGWIQRTFVDQSARDDQERALETILSGRVGGPWAKLAPFVGERLDTLRQPITIEDVVAGGSERSVRVGDVLKSTLAWLRGRDRAQPVVFGNIFNQIHAAEQEIALGSTTYDDDGISIHTQDTHALASRFEWKP